jgi:hypothetical protein
LDHAAFGKEIVPQVDFLVPTGYAFYINMETNEKQEPLKVLEKYRLPDIYNRTWQMLRTYGEPVSRANEPATEVGFTCNGRLEQMTKPATLRLLGNENNKLLITYETSTGIVKIEMDNENDTPEIQTLKNLESHKKGQDASVPDVDYADRDPEDILPNIVPLLDNAEDAIKLAQYLRRTSPVHPEPFSLRRTLSNFVGRITGVRASNPLDKVKN